MLNELNVATVPTQALGLKGLTKADLQVGAQNLVANMLEVGNELDVAVGLAAMENVIAEVKGNKEYIDAVREHIQQRGEKGKLKLPNGTIIEHAEVGIKFDYSVDAEWSKWAELESQYAELRKKREAILKGIPAGKMLTDPDTGDTTIGPPRSSKSSYKVSIASK